MIEFLVTFTVFVIVHTMHSRARLLLEKELFKMKKEPVWVSPEGEDSSRFTSAYNFYVKLIQIEQ